MARGNRYRAALPLLFAAIGLSAASVGEATIYSGNGATGFGGPVGTGSLTVTDNAAGDVTFSFQPGAGHPSVDGNSLVIYLSTGATGIVDTFPLSDIGDSGRRAISGYNYLGPDLDPTRSVIAFPSGFQATHALSMEGGYVGLFGLPLSGGDGGLSYITGGPQSGNPLAVTFPLASLGLSQGQSFQLVGTLIDGNAAYRSNETIGPTSPDVGAGGNPGFNNLITFSAAYTYQSTVASQASEWVSTTGGSWNDAPSWSAPVPNAAGAAAAFGPSLSTSQTVTLDGSKTVGTLAFNNATAGYTIAIGSGGSLTIDNTGGAAGSTPGIAVAAGSHLISAPVQLAGGMTASVSAGTQLTFSGIVGGSGDLTATGAGTVTLNATNTYSGNTTVNSGATLNVNGSLPSTVLNANGRINFGANAGAGVLVRSASAINLTATGVVAVATPSAPSARTVLVTGGLHFGGSSANWEGRLDLGANDMIVRGGNATALRSQLKQGLDGTSGLTSSAAAASSTPKTGLGYAVVTSAGTFDGQPVSAGDVVVKYTVVGDTDLDSAVNFPDLVTLAQNYSATNTFWASGDFNYDGTTDFADLVSLAQNYNATLNASQLAGLDVVGGSSFASDFALAQSLVPEPALGVFAAVALAAQSRRRRAH